IGVVVLTALAWQLAHRAAPVAAAALRREIAAARAHVRELPAWPLIASLPMTALNVGARIAVLPVLVSAMPSHPPLGVLIVGSFALLYSQLILPTPAGAGAVDLGFLGGAAGELGPAETSLLVAWRFYTNGLGVALGLVLTAARYGVPAFAVVLRRIRFGVASDAAPPGEVEGADRREDGEHPSPSVAAWPPRRTTPFPFSFPTGPSMPRDPSPPGPWQRVVRGTGWTANAPLAFVLLALVALATLPVLNERRTAPLNRELRDVLEPGRGLVTQIHVALAIEGAAIRDYEESGDTVFLTKYLQAHAEGEAAYEQLSKLAGRLGPEVQHRFGDLRDLERRWDAAIRQSLGDPTRDVARTGVPRPNDLYEDLLVAAAHLDEALSQDAQRRRSRLDATERLQRRLAVVLAVIAFAAGLGVAWLGHRVRVFARQAEQRRVELERATESRARLMRGISHDLKNPLGAIDGHAALLEAGVKGALTPDQRESVGRIRRSVRSLLLLINDLLELSKAEAGQLRIQLRRTERGRCSARCCRGAPRRRGGGRAQAGGRDFRGCPRSRHRPDSGAAGPGEFALQRGQVHAEWRQYCSAARAASERRTSTRRMVGGD
ncbi:MAG: hypothetical protein M3282_11345, partial [Gemmatimonadota bacterium]|nr:hypothetical protein [Gemmatimonadota bacterium]